MCTACGHAVLLPGRTGICTASHVLQGPVLLSGDQAHASAVCLHVRCQSLNHAAPSHPVLAIELLRSGSCQLQAHQRR